MSDDNLCAWHGCPHPRIETGFGIKIGPHMYHWQCIKELVDNGHIERYCTDAESFKSERIKMIRAADKAPKMMKKYPRR